MNPTVVLLEDILKELKPKRTISQGRTRVVIYKRLNTHFLTPHWIKKKYREKNVKDIPDIIRQGDYLVFQHQKYPPFYLSLEDGRLYYLPTMDTDLEHTKRTASIFLEIIRERVEGFKTRDIQPRIDWIRP